MPFPRGAISDYRPWRYECDEHRRCIKRDLLPEGLRESTPENMSFGRSDIDGLLMGKYPATNVRSLVEESRRKNDS